MRKYILKSDLLSGAVTFGFDAAGWLVYFLNEATFSNEQHTWLFTETRFPKRIEAIQALAKLIKGTLTEVPADLSFSAFWDAYDKKINKKRCEPMWKKMSDADKMQAIMNIKPYDAYLYRTGIGKAHPENYLKKEYFSVDWKREK